jgi:hypothetical protein
MVQVRRRDVTSPAAPDVAPMPLTQVIDGPRPIDPAQLRLWRDLRREADLTTLGTLYDVRAYLTRDGVVDGARWQADRRAHLARRFADDARVAIDV